MRTRQLSVLTRREFLAATGALGAAATVTPQARAQEHEVREGGRTDAPCACPRDARGSTLVGG